MAAHASPASPGTDVSTAVVPRGDGSPAAPRPAPAPATPPPERPYFRCHPLQATLAVAHCRANRAKVPWYRVLAEGLELPPWQIQPDACRSCALARRVEAGAVAFYTAGEVYAGAAREERSSTDVSSTPAPARLPLPPLT